MNIFALDLNPRIAAKYHCDKHVVKMVLETAQIITTVFHTFDKPTLYGVSHINHPCNIWSRHSKENFEWLLELGLNLSKEYYERYGKRKNKRHKSELVIAMYAAYYAKRGLPFREKQLTPFALAMPDIYKEGFQQPLQLYPIVSKLLYRRQKRLCKMAIFRETEMVHKPSRHEVTLEFFCDDANGEWGVTTKESLLKEGFNAFWTPVGIFHDVFEHWFEDKHEYFTGDACFNAGGEIAAMAAAIYYTMTLGFRDRIIGDYHPFEYSAADTAASYPKEFIYYPGGYFGESLISNVPRVKDDKVHSIYDLSSFVSEVYLQIKNSEDLKSRVKRPNKEEALQSSRMKRSCTYARIRDLSYWGYTMAENLVPDKEENLECLKNFYKALVSLTKIPAQTLVDQYYWGIDVIVTKNVEGIIDISMVLLADQGTDSEDQNIYHKGVLDLENILQWL